MMILVICCKKQTNTIDPVVVHYTANILNGYGSGSYKPGDSVHIWSRSCNTNETFSNWSNDSALLKSRNEWHSWFIMPAKNINLTANIKTVSYQLVSLAS